VPVVVETKEEKKDNKIPTFSNEKPSDDEDEDVGNKKASG